MDPLWFHGVYRRHSDDFVDQIEAEGFTDRHDLVGTVDLNAFNDPSQSLEIIAVNASWLFGIRYEGRRYPSDVTEDEEGYSFHQDFGFVEPKEPKKPKRIPLTPAEEYDFRNGLGRFWNPHRGREVKGGSYWQFELAIASEIPEKVFQKLLRQRMSHPGRDLFLREADQVVGGVQGSLPDEASQGVPADEKDGTMGTGNV